LTSDAPDHSARPGPWAELVATPLRMRLYLTVVAVIAVWLPVALNDTVEMPHGSVWLTVAALLGGSVLNVELSRWLSGGLAHTHQPHKALSAWAFATAMLLPPVWLLVVVPVTYAHARWRGIRVTLWKWVGSALYLVLSGVVAGAIRHGLMGSDTNWMYGDGRHGLVTMFTAGVAFLAVEVLLFTGSAVFNAAEDEVWLRAMLTSRAFYGAEIGVLLLGGLFAAVWAAGPWFTLFFIPIYFLVQHVVLLAPLRERAAAAAALAEKNAELERANATLEGKNAELDRTNQFKSDLVGMIGHEIGNPLTSVLGYAETGSEAVAAGNPEHAREAFEAVQRNAQKMAAVLSDIVHLVASERGVLTSRPEPLHLAPHLEMVTRDLPVDRRPRVECPPELGVLAQPGHLDQILSNLLSNAEKYAGGATRLVAAAADSVVRIHVIDEGPGVPDSFLGALFGRYRRDPEVASRIHGTGIGLFISRELARANGGDLLHHRNEPTGSRFVVELPLHGVEPATAF
jgi:signal transduction histidine kinase